MPSNSGTIEHLDGPLFRLVILSGARRVLETRRHLDEINVFPVPDGDTGTNLSALMRTVVEGLESLAEDSVDRVAAVVAELALMGAQGNSGVILAQFFQGLAHGFKGHARLTTKAFAPAAVLAGEWSAEAISRPKEGTILTVIRQWAGWVSQSSQGTQDFVTLFQGSLQHAYQALTETQRQLEVLRKAGVVDAGAQGFVFLLEGVVRLLEGREEAGELGETVPAHLSKPVHLEHSPDNPRFRYCTECILSGEQLDHRLLRSELEELGDSVIVAGSRTKARLHVHTDLPAKVFQTARGFGRLQLEKVDDIRQQYVDAFGEVRRDITIVTDSATDLPPEIREEYNIHLVPARLSFGEENFIDTITITPEQFYEKLAGSDHPPKTSQPTPTDFRRTYELIGKHYQSALSIHISDRLSGTFRSAQRIAGELANGIQVVDTRNLSVGAGLVVLEAARAVRQGAGQAEVLERVEDAIERVKIFIVIETLDYLVASGRVSRLKGSVASWLNRRPILTLEDSGTIGVHSTITRGEAGRSRVLELIGQKGGSQGRFAVAHANAPEKAEWYAQQIREAFEPRDIFISEVCPALGVHGGSGAIVIAFLGDEG